MEVFRIDRYPLPINLGFSQTLTFRPATVRFSRSSGAKEFPELSAAGQMFILGMGFVGKFFAAELKSKGWAVSGSCTSFEKKKKLEELGYQTYVFDANDPQNEVLEVVKNHTHLVISIPPIKGLGDPVYMDTLVRPASFHGSYPAKPETDIARARLVAEEEWLSLGQKLDITTQVLRLGGIYGPGRSAVDTILKQGPLSKRQKARSSKNYTSRVHVADICQALHASIANPSASKIYNIVDDDPASREVVFEYAQKLVEEYFPQLEKQQINAERGESFDMENPLRAEKRVSNARMKNELGVNLLYPSYKSGLRSIIELMAP